MTRAEAIAIAAEQIAFWQRQGMTADDAWRALGCCWAWAVEWSEVRSEMIRWLLADEYRPAEPFKAGALPGVPAPLRRAA